MTSVDLTEVDVQALGQQLGERGLVALTEIHLACRSEGRHGVVGVDGHP